MAKPKDPSNSGRFQKGRSGNLKGRPRAAKEQQTSAFDIVFNRTLTVMQNGMSREITIQEGLEHRTYRDAIDGSLMAQRTVLRWIDERNKVRAAKAPRNRPEIKHYVEIDPQNADTALQILGVATHNEGRDQEVNERVPLLLEQWAVQAALTRRRGGERLSDVQVAEIKRSTRDAGELRWPRGYER